MRRTVQALSWVAGLAALGSFGIAPRAQEVVESPVAPTVVESAVATPNVTAPTTVYGPTVYEGYKVKTRFFGRREKIVVRPRRFVVAPPVVAETRVVQQAPVVESRLVQPAPVMETRWVQPPPVMERVMVQPPAVMQRTVIQPEPIIQTRYLRAY